MKKPNYYRQILHVLESLRKAHPTYNIGRHISTALDDSDLWNITDKEFLLMHLFLFLDIHHMIHPLLQ